MSKYVLGKSSTNTPTESFHLKNALFCEKRINYEITLCQFNERLNCLLILTLSIGVDYFYVSLSLRYGFVIRVLASLEKTLEQPLLLRLLRPHLKEDRFTINKPGCQTKPTILITIDGIFESCLQLCRPNIGHSQGPQMIAYS